MAQQFHLVRRPEQRYRSLAWTQVQAHQGSQESVRAVEQELNLFDAVLQVRFHRRLAAYSQHGNLAKALAAQLRPVPSYSRPQNQASLPDDRAIPLPILCRSSCYGPAVPDGSAEAPNRAGCADIRGPV